MVVKKKDEDIVLGFGSTRLAKAGKKYSMKTGKFEALPEDYYITSMGKEVREKIPYSADYREVSPFSSELEILRPYGEEKVSRKTMMKLMRQFGLSQNNYDIRNVEGKEAVVIYPDWRIARYPETFIRRLERLKKQGMIEDYDCRYEGATFYGCVIYL